MNDKSLNALDDAGLRLEARSLEAQTGNVVEYEALKHISHGQFLLKELKLRRDFAQECYKHINSAHEHALTALVQLQCAEAEANHWINRIENSGDHLKEIQARRETLGRIAETRKKRAEDGPHFIPEALRKERENERSRRESTTGSSGKD